MALTTRQTTRKAYLEETLPKIEAAIAGNLGAMKIQLEGRAIERYSLEDLEKLRVKYDSELTRLERREAGSTSTSTIKAVF
jgi:hypothetical protein